MAIEAISSISISNTALTLYKLSDSYRRRLLELGVDVENVKTDEEAEAILAQQDKTQKVKETEEKGEVSYYDKQLMNEARLLALDLGLYVSEDTDMETLLYNISIAVSQLMSLFADNDNLKEVAQQFNDRYQNVYATYMSKRNTLEFKTFVNLV